MTADVVGRDAELQAIDAWLESPQPSTLVIEGDPGIGKSTLWRTAVAEAERRAFRVVACTAAGSETQLAFTTLRDLLADVFDEVAGELPAPQRHALAVVLLREEPGRVPQPAGAVGVALLTALTTLTAGARTLVAVDDAHWIDDASAGPLMYALRRLRSAEPAAILARRAGADMPALQSLPEARVRTVTLGPVSVGAMARILRDRLGTAYTRPTLHRLHETSGGNPFYALELARALGDHAQALAPSAALPLPTTLHELIDDRIEALPDDTRETLLVTSALARPTLATVGAALPGEPLSKLEPAIAAQVASVEQDVVRFAHPLFAAAVYELAAPAKRQQLHRRLAEVVSGAEERARHLALSASEPDATIADVLDRAAMLARARGAPGDAAYLSQEAARVTPAGDEDDAARRTIAAALWWTDAGDTQRSLALVEPLLVELPPGTQRLDALYAKARAVEDRVYGELLEEAVAEAEGYPTQHVRLLFLLCYALLHGLDFDAARTRAQAAVAIAEPTDDADSIVLALSMAGRLDVGCDGRAARLRRARELETDVSAVDAYESPATWLGWSMLANDELDDARRMLVEQHRKTLEDGDGWNQTFLHWPLTELECRSGDYDAARAYAESGLELAEQTDNLYAVSALRYCCALVAAHVGDSAAAITDAEASLAEAKSLRSALFTVRPRIALAFLAVSEGRHVDALDHLADLPGVALEGPYWATYPFWGDLVESLVSVGEVERAQTLLADLDVRGLADHRPGAAPELTRCKGLVAAAFGSLEGGVALLEEALRLERARSVPLERARTLLALGDAQRRAKQRRASRETLQEAFMTFESVGARLWVERATTELGRIGGRSASSESLTPAEQRVAELVAEGKSNKEVAAALVVSVHTVESALTSIYRKLGVHSRTEMARKLVESKD